MQGILFVDSSTGKKAAAVSYLFEGGAVRCPPALEQAQLFASHLAEVPERINPSPDLDPITQLAHGAILVRSKCRLLSA